MTIDSVSVHIVTYNSEKDIFSCLESVIRQTYPISEIIVVDNASLDASVQIVKEFSNQHPDVQIHVIENEENVGFAEAHNQAIRQSSAQYILILNPDVILHEDYIYHLLSYMRAHLEVGSATGKLYRHGNILDSTGLVINKARRARDRGAGEFDQGQWNDTEEVFGVSGAAALYKRDMILDVMVNGEFFDAHFFAYKEDVDVSWRSRLLGWKAYFVPQAVAFHKRGWAENKKRQDIPLHIRQHSFINRYYMMLKNDTLKYFFLHFLHILLFEVASLIYFSVKERKMLWCYRRFIKDLNSMKRKRKMIWKKVSRKNISIRNIYSFFQ